jgi:hypothetical protein
MGYSHFWRRPVVVSRDAWLPMQADIRRLINAFQSPLVWGHDEPNWKPEVSANLIQFNGQPGFEDFSFPRFYGGRFGQAPDAEGREFQCCKSGGRPYDVLLTASLIGIKRRLGDLVVITSDGEDVDWEPARAFCLKVLGYGSVYHIQGRTLVDVSRKPDAEPTKEVA